MPWTLLGRAPDALGQRQPERGKPGRPHEETHLDVWVQTWLSVFFIMWAFPLLKFSFGIQIRKTFLLQKFC